MIYIAGSMYTLRYQIMGIISGPFFPLDHENAIFFISIYILHHVSECNERFKLKEKDILL